jgi:hypothetical protein
MQYGRNFGSKDRNIHEERKEAEITENEYGLLVY